MAIFRDTLEFYLEIMVGIRNLILILSHPDECLAPQ